MQIYRVLQIQQLKVINILKQRKNGPHLADDISKCIFFNENVWFSNQISLQIAKDPIDNIGSENGLAPTRRQVIIWTNCC